MADDTDNRIESLAADLKLTVEQLIALCEMNGLELIATRPRTPVKHPGHC